MNPEGIKVALVSVFPKYKDGIPRSSEELLKEICDKDEVSAVSLIARKGLNFISPSVLEHEKVSLFTISRFLTPWQLIKLFKRYKECNVFLLLAPAWDIFDPLLELYLFFLLIKYRFLPRGKWVQMLHDFIPYVCAEDTGEEKRTLQLNNTFKKYFRSVPAMYVAISEATKRDAMRYWNISKQHIAVIHHGSFITPGAPRSAFGSKKVLMVSNISPRKNQTRLIQAFELVHRKSRNTELIIAGNVRKNVPEFESTLQAIRERNDDIKITISGYLADSDIRSLYDQADVFVYPSLYEGFGLPVLEAMACGCPVITSNLSSLPEVSGDAGILVDPYNVDELAEAMLRVLEDNDLKREMSKRSIARAHEFSWNKACDQWLTVCRQVMHGSQVANEAF